MPDPVRPIVGHHAGWGLTSGSRIEPYKLSPGSIDTMCVKVREKFDIHGVGTDVVLMQGTFTVRRDHPCAIDGPEAKWGESCVKTEFRSLELFGESPVFGTVRVHLDPDFSSHGEVGPAQSGSLAADCVAHCFPVVELPELNMRLTTNGQSIDLASKVVQIPPVGDVARSSNSAMLVDDFGNTVGEIVSSDIEVGDVVCSVPLGRTSPKSDQHQHSHHGPHSHPDPSGPGFYAEPPGRRRNPAGTGGGGHTHGGGQGGHTHGGGSGPGGGSGHGGGTQLPDDVQRQLTGTLERLEDELRTLISMLGGGTQQP